MNVCHLQGLLKKSQSSKLSGCWAGSVDFTQSYGMQHESENPLSGVTIGFFPQKISLPYMHTTNDKHKEKKENSVTMVDMKRKYNTESLQN